MKKIIITLVLFLSIGFAALAQKTIDKYQYVIIPLQYDFLSKKDQYRLNTLTRYLFKQKGFVALFDEEDFPEELKKDRCKALYVNVEKVKKNLFTTRLEIVLKDCFGKELYRTETGTSRQKEFKKAYPEALRNAFSEIEFMEYNFQPLKADDKIKDEESADTVIDVDETKNKKSVETSPEVAELQSTNTTLYAQEKSYGYQLVDATPKIIMQLLKTSAADVFIVKDKNAIVYKEDGFWYYSENNGELKEPKALDIKF